MFICKQMNPNNFNLVPISINEKSALQSRLDVYPIYLPFLSRIFLNLNNEAIF